MSLYTKYRPHTFSDVVDQTAIRTTLQNAVRLGKLSHAYLFCGPRGTGKTSLARILAYALVCAAPASTGDPCGTCEFCVDALDERLVDIFEIDAASHRGIDEIRDLKEKVNYLPTRAKRKVYIIDEVHMLTKDAFNALLKTLEEPPLHVHFILATTEAHKVLETIVSRCQRYDFRHISSAGIEGRLRVIAEKEGFSFTEEALSLIAASAGGGLRDAIRTMEQAASADAWALEEVRALLGLSSSVALGEYVQTLIHRDTQTALTHLQNIFSYGVNAREFVKDVIAVLREHMLEALTLNNTGQLSYFIHCIDVFEKARTRLKDAAILTLPLEIATIEACLTLSPASVSSSIASAATPVLLSSPVVSASPSPLSSSVVESSSSPAPSLPSSPVSSVPVTPVSPVEEKILDTQVSEVLTQHSPDYRPLAAPEEAVVAPSPSSVDLLDIQKNWQRLCVQIPKASIKLSLRESMPAALTGNNKLLIQFRTRFSLDKVMTQEGMALLQQVLSTAYHQQFELAAEVSTDLLPPLPTPSVAESHSPSPSSQSSSSSASALLSVFGGSEIF